MSKIFSPLRIGQLELAHRLVTTVRPGGRFETADYRERATAGGLVITETLGNTAELDRWEQIAGAIHHGGGIAVALVVPHVARQQPADVVIDSVMKDYQRVAQLARDAGFDGVELDASAGSLADGFLQPQINSRDDEYGGDVEGRMAFLLEVAHVVAGAWSNERVGIRLSPCARKGQVELFAEVMRALSERELAYVHLANGSTDATNASAGHTVSIATAADRRAFRSDLSCALIATDHVDVGVAASAIGSRWADAIGFLQVNDDPCFIKRLLGREKERQAVPT
jgi:2,4-dienoyl-CoA reductase-like NADH-dependent reductase (Old Yellow Enzyme family)